MQLLHGGFHLSIMGSREEVKSSPGRRSIVPCIYEFCGSAVVTWEVRLSSAQELGIGFRAALITLTIKSFNQHIGK